MARSILLMATLCKWRWNFLCTFPNKPITLRFRWMSQGKHMCQSMYAYHCRMQLFIFLRRYAWLSFNLKAYADRVHSFNFVKSLCSFSIADFEIIASLNQRVWQINPISLPMSYCRSSLCLSHCKHWTYVLLFKKSSITYVQKDLYQILRALLFKGSTNVTLGFTVLCLS